MRKSPQNNWLGLGHCADARAWWIPLFLLVLLALLNRQTAWYLEGGWGREGVTLVGALLALWAWHGAALAPPPPPTCAAARRPLRADLTGIWLGLTWSGVWVLLPAWGLLKVVCLATYVPVMAWRRHKAEQRAHAWGLLIGWLVSLGGVLFGLLANPWRAERLLQAVWPSEVDRHGAHFAWSRLMEALAALSPTGGGWSGVPPVLTQVDDAARLLRLGASFGWVPMALLGCSVVLLWLLVGGYVARSPVGARLSLRARRLGKALAWLHALAAALYAAWAIGFLYRPMGAQAPLAHAGWVLLTLTLGVIVWRAWGQRRQSAKTPVANLPRPVARGGVWRSGWAMAGLGWISMSLIGMVSFPTHVAAWKEAQAAHANLYRPSPRLELADRTGEQLLARNILAYDVWIRTADFWAASWANPKQVGDWQPV